jgi:ATP diphosphatase
MSDDQTSGLERLREIMRALRDSTTGCPWDIEQTFATISPYTVEEAYEVADAIGRNDMIDLCDELGDLLLQVIYHSQMAEELGAFRLEDVVSGICDKMIGRHPHVFGTAAERAAGPQDGAWEQIKKLEKLNRAQRKQEAGDGSSGKPAGLLADVPNALPALVRASKLQRRAATVGFDWPSPSLVLEKMREELDELEAALAENEADQLGQTMGESHLAEELGDLLFASANFARHFKFEAEDAVDRANAKFIARFGYVEQQCKAAGIEMTPVTLTEMEALWQEAKIIEKAPPADH